MAEEAELGRRGLAVVSELGRGFFARVLLVQRRDERGAVSAEFALKVMEPEQIGVSEAWALAEREIDIMKRLRHPRLVELVDSWKSSSGRLLFVLLELCPGGDLLGLWRRVGSFPEASVLDAARQLAQAMDYLHSQDIAHRDLKMENVMVMARFAWHTPMSPLKLGDFTMARTVEKGQLCSTVCGSREYMCPELLAMVPYDAYAADVWALGVLLFALLLGRMPFPKPQHQPLSDEETRGHVELLQKRREHMPFLNSIHSARTAAIIRSALTYSQDSRPNIHQLLTRIPSFHHN